MLQSLGIIANLFKNAFLSSQGLKGFSSKWSQEYKEKREVFSQ